MNHVEDALELVAPLMIRLLLVPLFVLLALSVISLTGCEEFRVSIPIPVTFP